MQWATPGLKNHTLSMLITVAFTAASPQVFAEDGLEGLGDLVGGSFRSRAYAVSSDGSVVVGHSASASSHSYYYEAFRWTAAGGMVGLGDLAGGDFWSLAHAVNSDGSVVVGHSEIAGDKSEAFRWTEAGGMVGLGESSGRIINSPTYGDIALTHSQAYGVSSDGSVVVGASQNTSGIQEAFRWTEAGGMVGLGDLAGGIFSSTAKAVSSDGSVVVGVSRSTPYNQEAFRWTEAGGMVGLGYLSPGYGLFDSVATAVSSDGSVVVGHSEIAGDSCSTLCMSEAFRWTEAGGMVGLHDLAGDTVTSKAYGVSSDGSVVVGGDNFGGFRWTEAGGIVSVEQWLTDSGVTVGGGISTHTATGTNGDGSVVVGYGEFGSGTEYEAYIARVGSSGSGVITVSQVSQSLSSTSQGASMALRSTNMLVNGGHSRPMSRKVAIGQKALWLTGNWGHDHHNGRDGTIGLAEVGLGYNFGTVQVNISLGETGSKQVLVESGGIDSQGKYAMVEGILPIAEDAGLYATLGMYGHRGDADIRRGYLNAGLSDFSSGNPDTRTWGLRARLDWEDAYTVKAVQFSPYADLSYSKSKADGYTETGGGFAARFDSSEEEVTELRAGFNMAMPITTANVHLVGNLEVTHRFDNKGAGTSGQLIGLFAFDLEGREYDSTWVKGGIGIEGELGKGKAFLMLNGTTEGEMPSAWLTASYQMLF